MLDSRTRLPSPWLRHDEKATRHTAAACMLDYSPSAASYVGAPSVVVAEAGRSLAVVVFASPGSPGSDVEVVGARVGKQKAVGDIARRTPCRIEEGGDGGSAASHA